MRGCKAVCKVRPQDIVSQPDYYCKLLSACDCKPEETPLGTYKGHNLHHRVCHMDVEICMSCWQPELSYRSWFILCFDMLCEEAWRVVKQFVMLRLDLCWNWSRGQFWDAVGGECLETGPIAGFQTQSWKKLELWVEVSFKFSVLGFLLKYVYCYNYLVPIILFILDKIFM